MPTITDPLKLADTIEDAASLILRWGHAQMRQLPAAEIEMLVAALRAYAKPEGVPSGWKLVPIEPTNAMFEALYSAPEKPVGEKWDAMLACAPLPQKDEA